MNLVCCLCQKIPFRSEKKHDLKSHLMANHNLALKQANILADDIVKKAGKCRPMFSEKGLKHIMDTCSSPAEFVKHLGFSRHNTGLQVSTFGKRCRQINFSLGKRGPVEVKGWRAEMKRSNILSL